MENIPRMLLECAQMAGIRFVIAGSYGMREVRAPRDFDVLVHPEDWEKLVDLLKDVAGFRRKECRSGDCVAVDQVEFFNASFPAGFAYTDITDYGVDQNGFPCWKLHHTKRWKTAFGRPKDKADLELIENWEREQAETLVNVSEYADWDF